MQLHIYEHKKAGTLHPVFAVSSFMGGDYIDLIELKELVAEAVILVPGYTMLLVICHTKALKYLA